MNIKRMIALAVMPVVLFPSMTLAKSKTGSELAIGVETMWPTYGLSAKLEVDPLVTVQGTLGTFHSIKHLSGRVSYKFSTEPDYNLYSFGMAGLYRDSDDDLFDSKIGIGAGVGVEYDLSSYLSGMPITVDGELGVSFVDLEDKRGEVAIGLGVHYWLAKDSF